MRRRGRWRNVLTLTPATLTAATILLALSDLGAGLTEDTVFPGGPLDETAHVLTTLLAFWAFWPAVRRRILIPALIASVVIDADHIPGQLGVMWLTDGTPRPYTHSLLTILIVLACAWRWRRQREVALGVAIGLTLHLARDLGEGGAGVSLLWPVSYHSYQYPHGAYAAAMAIIVVLAGRRCLTGNRSVRVPLSGGEPARPGRLPSLDAPRSGAGHP